MPKEEEKPSYYVKVSIFRREAIKPTDTEIPEAIEQGTPQKLHCKDWQEANRLFDLLVSIRLVDPLFWPLIPTFVKFLQQLRNVLEFE